MNGMCDRCGKTLSTGDFNQLCRNCDDWLEKNYPSKVLEAATITFYRPATGPWQTTEPPRNREFLAMDNFGCVELCDFWHGQDAWRWKHQYEKIERSGIVAWAEISKYGRHNHAISKS